MKNYNKILEAVNRGIKFALDDYEDDEIQGQTNSKVSHQHGTKEWLDLMEEVVDLDLPSGTLWCKYNLDVDPNQLTKAEDWYGGYFAWGEITNKSYYGWNNYKFKFGLNNFSKYNEDDNLTELLPEDDVTYQNKHIGNYKFHIPTKEQFDELLKYTKNYWVNNYDPNKLVHNPEDDKGIQGLNGRVFEEKNGNQLFIPAAGYQNRSDIRFVGSCCFLWSSSFCLDYPDSAYGMYFNSDGIGMGSHIRCFGFIVHPVINL